jgi:hypothetical protein
MSDKIEQALEAYRKGDKKQCLQIVGPYLKANPQSERGWLIAAECIDDTDKKRQCYRRVLRINPDNKLAIEELDALDNPAIVCPSCGEQVGNSGLVFCPNCKANMYAQTEKQRGKAQRKDGTKTLAKVVVGAFALLMLSFVIVYHLEGGTSASLSIPSPTSTSTARHTNTPKPTATPGLTRAEQRYIGEALDIVEQYPPLYNDFSVYANEASRNPALILDDDWRLEVVTILAQLTMLNEEVRSLEYPQSCADIQTHLVDMADHSDRFVSLTAEGIDEMNGDKLISAAHELDLASEEADKIKILIQDFRD